MDLYKTGIYDHRPSFVGKWELERGEGKAASSGSAHFEWEDSEEQVRAAGALAKPVPFRMEEASYLQTVGRFWLASVQTARQIGRNECTCSDEVAAELKLALQQMVNWHARTWNGAGDDIWQAGRFMEERTDRKTLAELRSAYGCMNQADYLRALHLTIRLFRRLSREVAVKQHLVYPYALECQAAEWIEADGKPERRAALPAK